jgi:acyl-homoserine lactone acylase PvdQ
VGLRTRAVFAALVLVVTSAVACTSSPGGSGVPISEWPGGDAVPDPALAAMTVMPPGNGNLDGFTRAFSDDQRVMFDALDDPVAAGTLTDADLPKYFKDAHLGGGRIVRVDQPRPGVLVGWDSFGVPHVKGRTDDDVAFGAGWVTGASRLLVAELARIVGRAGAIEMGGGDLLTALAHLGDTQQINYTDAELDQSVQEAVDAAGPDGPGLLSALDAYTAGMNHWLDDNTFPKELQDLGLKWQHWSRADVIAVGSVVDDIFGSGGGSEVRNADALRALTAALGPDTAAAVYTDLRMADDPRATTQIDTRFPYPLYADQDGTGVGPGNQVDPRSVALPDAPTPVAGPSKENPTASNYLIVDRGRSRSGHPIMVGGPQTSFLYPGLLFEMELQGGSYDSRGATVPGLGPWVVVGRSRGYGWTVTAGGSDLTDQRVERLCEPDASAPTKDSTHYLFKGQCLPMTRPDDRPQTAWRTVHGPVVGRAEVGGLPVAISRQRMSRLQTAQATRAFWALNHGRVREAADFAPTMSSIPMSFNWSYVNDRDVAYFHSGYYPIRARGVPEDLPTWGTGDWEWRGRLDWHQLPQAIDPPSGIATSWNNKVAPGWHTADNDWGVGSVQRVDLINRAAVGLHDATPADLVSVVQDAGTADLRGQLVLGPVLAILDSAPAPNAELAAVRDGLARWSAAGAHRRDRDGDGFYDDPMVPIMDVWFNDLVGSVFAPALRDFFVNDELRRPSKVDIAPSFTGNAFGRGWYSLLTRDLERVAGSQPTPTGVPVFCGQGSLTACRDTLWRSLGAAVFAAGPFPKWAALERVRFIPFVFNGESVRWVNRSTYQQVLSFGDAVTNGG